MSTKYSSMPTDSKCVTDSFCFALLLYRINLSSCFFNLSCTDLESLTLAYEEEVIFVVLARNGLKSITHLGSPKVIKLILLYLISFLEYYCTSLAHHSCYSDHIYIYIYGSLELYTSLLIF